ncbi:MAG: LiaI-LiaF-like domain-containing protein [Bacillota bacterium]
MNKEKRSQITAGIILIGFGILFLLNTLGIIKQFNWRLLYDFWPVIIILIGLNILLKNTRLWWLTSVVLVLSVFAVFIVNDGSFYNYSSNYKPSFSHRSYSGTYNHEASYDDGMEEMDISINFAAGRLAFETVDNLDKLYEARLQYDNQQPEVNYHLEKEKAYLTIKEREKSRSWLKSPHNDWQIDLNPDIPIDMQVNAGAGDFIFNLEEQIISNLIVNSGAGNLRLRLGENTEKVQINTAAGNIDISVPEGMSLCIKSAGIIKQNNFAEADLVKGADNTYQSKDYQDSEQVLKIEINTSVSKTNLNYY